MHQCVNYEDSMSRLAVKPCPRCRAIERDNRRLRIRLGLATGRTTYWQRWHTADEQWQWTGGAAHLSGQGVVIRLGDGTREDTEQEQKA